MTCMKKVIIIGGGAAGFFTAINAKEMNPSPVSYTHLRAHETS